MAVMDIAIEIGTSFTSIYLSGSGVVLREPTVVAFIGENENKKLLAAGVKAVQMQGRAPEKPRWYALSATATSLTRTPASF